MARKSGTAMFLFEIARTEGAKGLVLFTKKLLDGDWERSNTKRLSSSRFQHADL